MLSFVPFQKATFPQWRGIPLLQYFSNQKSSLPLTTVQQLNPLHQIWIFDNSYFVVLDSLSNMNPSLNDQLSSQLFHSISNHSKKQSSTSVLEIISEKPILCGYAPHFLTFFLWNDFLFLICKNGHVAIWKYQSDTLQWNFIQQLSLPYTLFYALFHPTLHLLFFISDALQLFSVEFTLEPSISFSTHFICNFSLLQKECVEYDVSSLESEKIIPCLKISQKENLIFHTSQQGLWILDTHCWYHVNSVKIFFYVPLSAQEQVLQSCTMFKEDSLFVLQKNGFAKLLLTPIASQQMNCLLTPLTLSQPFHMGMESFLNYPEKYSNFSVQMTTFESFVMICCQQQSIALYTICKQQSLFLLQTSLPSEMKQEKCQFIPHTLMMMVPSAKLIYQIQFPSWNELIQKIVNSNTTTTTTTSTFLKEWIPQWNIPLWKEYYSMLQSKEIKSKNMNPTMLWTSSTNQSLFDQQQSYQQIVKPFLEQFPLHQNEFWKSIDRSIPENSIDTNPLQSISHVTPLNLQTVPLIVESYQQVEHMLQVLQSTITNDNHHFNVKKEKQWKESLLGELSIKELMEYKNCILEWMKWDIYSSMEIEKEENYLEFISKVQFHVQQEITSMDIQQMNYWTNLFLYSPFLQACLYDETVFVKNQPKNLEKVMQILFFSKEYSFLVIVWIHLLEKCWQTVLKRNKQQIETLLQNKSVSISEVHSKLQQTNVKLNHNIKVILSTLFLQHCNGLFVNGQFEILQNSFLKEVIYTKEQILCLVQVMEWNGQVNQGFKLLLAKEYILEAYQYLCTVYGIFSHEEVAEERQEEEELIPLLENETKEQRQELVYTLQQFCYHSELKNKEHTSLLRKLYHRLGNQQHHKENSSSVMDMFQLYEYNTTNINLQKEEEPILVEDNEELTVEYFKTRLLFNEEDPATETTQNSVKSPFIYK